MNNRELAENVMGWTWKILYNDSGAFVGNWWYDSLGIQTNYGSHSMFLDPEHVFDPHTKIHDAFGLLYTLENIESPGIEWLLKSEEGYDGKLWYLCIISGSGSGFKLNSGRCTSPHEAICRVASMFAEEFLV